MNTFLRLLQQKYMPVRIYAKLAYQNSAQTDTEDIYASQNLC